jgi:hypothetical protein
MITFHISGRILIDKLNIPVPNVLIKAYDKDLFFDDVLGSDTSDENGYFNILSSTNDFREFFEKNPDIYFKVFDKSSGKLLYESDNCTTINVEEEHEFIISIPESKLDTLSSRSISFQDENGEIREDFDPGEDIRLNISRLKASHPYTLRISDNQEELFSSRVISDRYGQLENVNVWPQFGLDNPRTDDRFTVQKAREFWSGRSIQIDVLDGDELIVSNSFEVPNRFTRPLLIGTDENGFIRNGFVVGDAEARISIYNPDFEGTALVYMVPRQHNWQEANSFTPVTLQSGRTAVTEIEVDGQSEFYEAVIANQDELEIGAYDFIVRPWRYGYEDDEDFTIRRNDLVTRFATGLVVREDFMESKFALGGCVNTLQISGRKILGSPYFRYSNVFEVGEDVYGALDPNALSPSIFGKMVALHVVQHKNAAGWTADNSLTHLPVLGGNANVTKVKVYGGCINANDHLLWPNANQEGLYDIVADFGNNTTDASAFVPDHQFNSPPTDFIDGYYLPGFRIVKDPGTETSFNHAGQFQYNEGAHTVQDDLGTSRTGDLQAQVYFPADVAGATQPNQLSASQANYPLIIIIHGQSLSSNSYEGYNYLLEHLAKNGFIAASIHIPVGVGDWRGVDRARMGFQHISILKTKFGNTKIQNNIGMMGHSRGGEAVASAVRLNQQDGLGHNINAIISLAPTDQYTSENVSGAWATPYMNIYGSMDGDVKAVDNNGFRLYDRASGEVKSFVFVYGATHGRFNTVWGDTDVPWLHPSDQTKLINMDAHQKIAKAYMTAFFKTHMLSSTKYEEMYKGEWIPSSVTTADSGKARLFLQYQADNQFKIVDNFEGTSNATSWQTSSIGGVVSDGNTLPTNPQDNALNSLDSHSPHDTKGMQFRWDNTSDFLSFDIPNADKDVSSYQAISFRVTQKTDSPHNPANAAQDLYVALEDTTNTKRSIKVSKFGEIPEPHVRGQNVYTKSAMNTIRIPLHAFTIKCAGLADVDLSNVTKIRFEFLAKNTGEIAIDSVQFTK